MNFDGSSFALGIFVGWAFLFLALGIYAWGHSDGTKESGQDQ